MGWATKYKLAIIQIGYQKDGATINIYKLYQHSGYNPTIIVASQELRIKKKRPDQRTAFEHGPLMFVDLPLKHSNFPIVSIVMLVYQRDFQFHRLSSLVRSWQSQMISLFEPRKSNRVFCHPAYWLRAAHIGLSRHWLYLFFLHKFSQYHLSSSSCD